MKKVFLIAFLFISGYSFSQDKLPFKKGEFAEYKISFGPIWVGHATLELKEIIDVDNRPTFHVIGKGKTAPFFDWFFKVRDMYETFIDTSTLLPIQFIRDVNEGGYLINQNYSFNHKDSIVNTQDSIFKIKSNSQDMLSALYYARTFNKKDVTDSSSFFVPIFMDDENYSLEIKFLYNEILETKWGQLECMVFQPKMQEGRVFEDGEKMKIWISNDSNHFLVKVETQIWAGIIKAVLEDYKELKYPLSIIEK